MTKLNVHWFIYPILCAALVGALWMWQDTQSKEIASLKAEVTSAKQAQQNTDKQAQQEVKQAVQQQTTKNKTLETILDKAKSPEAQVAVVNQSAGTQIKVDQAKDPSDTTVTLEAPKVDILKLAQQATKYEECQNQVAVDQVQQAADKSRMDAANERITAQDKEITAQNGGSHFKRFLKAAKWWGIGAGSGIVTGIVIGKKF